MRRVNSLVRLFLVAGLLLVLLVSVQVNSCDAVVQWSDDFSDGNYDGWTVVDGEWSAADNSLEVVGGTPVDCDGCMIPGTIYHDSSVTSGTWSFDIEYDLDFIELRAIPKVFFMSTDPEYWNGYCIELQRVVLPDSTFAALRLLRGTTIQGRVGADYTTLGSFDIDEGKQGIKHIDVTRTAEGQITVWIDGAQAIQATDTTVDVESCEYFIVSLNKEWAIDNFIVDDEITVGQIPLTLIAVSGSAATIMILVILGLRIKRT